MAQDPKILPDTKTDPSDLPPDTPPVFDEGQDDLPWPQDDTLPIDDDGNILPGNDPLDEDPNDNGDREQFDPEDIRIRRDLGDPIQE